MSLSTLVCLNQFKGTLTNAEACHAVLKAANNLGINATSLPIGDGGRGTLEAVAGVFGGERVSFSTVTPLGQPVDAEALYLADKNSLYVESAASCGYHLVPAEQRNPMKASSKGLGILIKTAFAKYASLKEVYVGLGDSAVSDAGMGLLEGLGFVFKDEKGQVLEGNGENLERISEIDPPAEAFWKNTKFTIMADVANSLCGPEGSARVFGPQKGATPDQVEALATGMENFAALTKKTIGKNIFDTPRTGSAGGLSAAFFAYLEGELVSGAKDLFDWLDFDAVIAPYDLIVTGEGCTDKQTLSGKGPMEVIHRASRAGKKVAILSGALGEGHEALNEMESVVGCFACGMSDNPSQRVTDVATDMFKQIAL